MALVSSTISQVWRSLPVTFAPAPADTPMSAELTERQVHITQWQFHFKTEQSIVHTYNLCSYVNSTHFSPA
jgi:hypothetical protein